MASWKKALLAVLLCLLLLPLGAVVWLRYQGSMREKAAAAAEALYLAGDYAKAAESFTALGLTERAQESERQILRGRYVEAEALLDGGEFLDAKAAFLALGDFEDAESRAMECDYRRAEHYYNSQHYDEAISLLAELKDFPGAAELLGSCRDTLYAAALEATYACRMDEAIARFNELGDYKDSLSLKKRCEERIVAMASPLSNPINYSAYAGQAVSGGTLYYHQMGLIFVPKALSPETGCMIFYPGGYDEALANNYLTEYVYAPDPPNALMLLCYANGFGHMDDKVEASFALLEQAALENNIFLHDLVLCGASNGAYTACHAAAQLYEDYGVRAKAVMTFDAGMHWEIESHILTPEECDSTAKAGTQFLLLEGGGIGMNKRAIELMVAHGNNVTVVECVASGHYGIIYDAISYGMIDWALGKGTRPDNPNYTYHPLDRNATYPYGA